MEFFDKAPDEELTIRDVITKLGCSYRAALMTITRLAEKDLVERITVVRLTPEQQRMRRKS